MRLRLKNVAVLDLTKAAEETLSSIESIRNTALMLVGADKRALFQQAVLSNVAHVETIPEGVVLTHVNGVHQITADALEAKPVYLYVSGKLIIQQNVSAEQLRRQLAGGIVNGKVICTEAQLAALTSVGLRVNGKSDAYPDGSLYRSGDSPLTCNEAALAEKDLYLAERITIEAGALTLLRQAGRRLFGKDGIVVPEAEQEALRAVWHGTGEVLIVPEGFHFVNKSLDINAMTSYQLRGKRFVNGSLTLQSSVESRHLEALEAIHVAGKVTLPIALLEDFLSKLVNEPDILPYEGRLVANDTELILTEAMLSQSDQPLTIINKAAMTMEKTIPPALLREKVVLLINRAALTISPEQQAALFDRLENSGGLEVLGSEEISRPVEEPVPEDVRVIKNVAHLVL